ncbi:MAG: 30S ribosomal protein S24e [Methanosarcinales archaeon]|nr:30S ribosomal protein S24e [Methanosarcinales archaeon]
MDIEIISKKENPLLQRTELTFTANADGATPTRSDVKNKLVAMLDSSQELLILDNIETRYGSTECTGYVKVYETAERAKQIEFEHVIAKNAVPEAPVEEVVEETAAAEEVVVEATEEVADSEE